MSEKQTDTGELRRVVDILDQLERRVERHNVQINSTDRDSPGLAMRQDRTERQIRQGLTILKWIGGGGLISLAASVYLLREIVQAIAKASGGG